MAPTLLTSIPKQSTEILEVKKSLRQLDTAIQLPTSQMSTTRVIASWRPFLLGFICGACFTGLLALGGRRTPTALMTASSFADGKASQFLGPQTIESVPTQNVSTEMAELQIDVRGVPSKFLDSTQEVHHLMEAAISQMESVSILQMMTYHFQPIGLTSLWLLSASHASIHTWPDDGFAAIDVLTCGSTDLLQISSVFKELFHKIDENITFHFSLTSRGHKDNKPVNDLAVQLSQMQQDKQLAYRGTSQFQSIDVWDVTGRSWVDGEHEHTARRLYLDGVLQLSSDDEAVYHETFIHPAMLAHKGPEHVVIMGGGDGGALNNVLHHRSVKSAVLVEIDEKVINVSKEVFVDFENAFYDPRTTVVVEDAFLWIANYSRKHAGSLDALFFDLLDINVPSPLLDVLFVGDRLPTFIEDAKTSLHTNGFAVFQLGEKRIMDECVTLGGFSSDCIGAQRQHAFVEYLKKSFKHVFLYSQHVPSFLGTWLFAVATDDEMCLQRWGRAAHQVDVDIVQRLYQHEALGFFNGSTMQGLRAETDVVPVVIPLFNKTSHVDDHTEVRCANLKRERQNSKLPGYQVPYMLASSKQGHGIGVYALRPIRRGEVIWRFRDESFIEVTPDNWREVVDKQRSQWGLELDAFLEKDWINEWLVPGHSGVKLMLELDDARFTNHGYTSDSSRKYLQIADEKDASEAPEEYAYGRVIIALRDIDACEEILESYQSSNDFDHDYDTPTWWIDVLKSHGLTNQLGFPPSYSDFPSWGWQGKPSNSD
jgi:spermidine synthase